MENNPQQTIKVANHLSNMPPKPELSSDQRKQVVSQLLLLLEDGNQPPKLKRSVLTTVANIFQLEGANDQKNMGKGAP
jgi:hypothetical protein